MELVTDPITYENQLKELDKLATREDFVEQVGNGFRLRWKKNKDSKKFKSISETIAYKPLRVEIKEHPNTVPKNILDIFHSELCYLFSFSTSRTTLVYNYGYVEVYDDESMELIYLPPNFSIPESFSISSLQGKYSVSTEPYTLYIASQQNIDLTKWNHVYLVEDSDQQENIMWDVASYQTSHTFILSKEEVELLEGWPIVTLAKDGDNFIVRGSDLFTETWIRRSISLLKNHGLAPSLNTVLTPSQLEMDPAIIQWHAISCSLGLPVVPVVFASFGLMRVFSKDYASYKSFKEKWAEWNLPELFVYNSFDWKKAGQLVSSRLAYLVEIEGNWSLVSLTPQTFSEDTQPKPIPFPTISKWSERESWLKNTGF
jgi:hypothetical protein